MNRGWSTEKNSWIMNDVHSNDHDQGRETQPSKFDCKSANVVVPRQLRLKLETREMKRLVWFECLINKGSIKERISLLYCLKSLKKMFLCSI